MAHAIRRRSPTAEGLLNSISTIQNRKTDITALITQSVIQGLRITTTCAACPCVQCLHFAHQREILPADLLSPAGTVDKFNRKEYYYPWLERANLLQICYKFLFFLVRSASDYSHNLLIFKGASIRMTSAKGAGSNSEAKGHWFESSRAHHTPYCLLLNKSLPIWQKILLLQVCCKGEDLSVEIVIGGPGRHRLQRKCRADFHHRLFYGERHYETILQNDSNTTRNPEPQGNPQQLAGLP